MSDLNHSPRVSAAPRLGEGPSPLKRAVAAVPGPLWGLLLVCAVFAWLSPYFLTSRNLINIFSQVSEIGIMAAGAALVIIIGGIDLSVGAVLAVSLMVNAWLYRDFGLPFGLSALAGLGVGAFVGLINGVLSTYGRIQPFVATLATMSACSGIALFITNGAPITGFPEWFTNLSRIRLFGIPLEMILLFAVYLAVAFWLHFRPTGRSLYAIGGNEEVARLSGIRTRRVKVLVYVIAGTLAALAGLILGSRLDSAHPTAGIADLLSVIAVVVIGGASLAGGSGGMLGTFIGLLIIGVLQNGMALLNVSPNLQPVVIGVAIILAVMLDRKSKI
ncbi:Ribose transport system permease protein RbsC [Paracoccus haematequi]|uniref:Ribose transport system permease protein RbsC n=1 Tax=Paracoccus haematequi TaxID=2491866 RepID=A0A3S4CIG1_9RHOB|nr:ABC transporter permease [Paracoccus haematequi]VDS08450.1 Ribose transport system permease protein RbsC [Paracoccus haematequi]